MKKGIASYCLTIALLGASMGFTACSDSDGAWNNDPQDYSSTKVTAFSLQSSKSILNNLDSVFFSIDLIDARIFNANPLPCDTRIDSLLVNVSCDDCRTVQFIVPAGNKKPEETLDYIADRNVAIDFSRGPVKMHLVALDGVNSRDYSISVNVYTQVTDSLYWDKLDGGQLKGIAGMNQAKAIKAGDNALVLSTAANGDAAISTFIPSPKTGGGTWQPGLITPSFPSRGKLKVESFTATESGEIFVIDDNGALFRSVNGGTSFTLVDRGWESVSAPYENGVIGVKNNAGSRTYAAYPTSVWPAAGAAVANRFPTEGHSAAVAFSTKWATKPQIVITGGKTATGAYTGTWAFDGSKWAEISNTLPSGSGWQISRYTIAETDTVTWQTSRKDVIIAFGGRNNNGISSETWISRDMGVNWSRASRYLQLPAYITPLTSGASLLVFDKTLTPEDAAPMAIRPVTEWECPYLYLFGGYAINGALRDRYWSGVVNHLRVKPLQ